MGRHPHKDHEDEHDEHGDDERDDKRDDGLGLEHLSKDEKEALVELFDEDHFG